MSRPATHGDSLDRTLVERRDPLLGTVLDQRFRIDQPIAAGGFGAIYRATDMRSDDQVALKVLHARFALDPMVVARFRREGKMLASLRDPHTVTAYEIGEAIDGTLYMVMELLYGESLYQRLRTGGPLPWRRALHIASGVCSSLAEAHALGMVHRDLKPANIHLETRDGDPDFVKVLDFGIAKIVQGNEVEHTQLTQAGQMIGTLDYMSPEQMVGGELTPASDIFTLGVVMYEMITGQTPFATAQNPTAILAALLTRVPDPVSTLARVPAAIDTIVARCLARDSSRRYREVSDLSESLSLVLADTGSGRRRDSSAASGFELAVPATDREDAVPAVRRDESIMVTVPNTVVRSAVRHDSVMATNPNGVARLSGFEKTAHANGSEHTGRETGFDQRVLTGEATRIDVRVSDSPEPVLDARGPRGSQQAMEPRPLPPPPEASRPPEPVAATPPQAWHSPASASPPASPYANLPTVFTGALPGYPNAPGGYAAPLPGYGPPPGAAISAPTILGVPPLVAPPPGGPAMNGPALGSPAMGGPVIAGPVMGGPLMGGPAMGGPLMGGPAMGGPAMGGPAMGGPAMGGPAMGGPAMGGHPMGGHPMNGPMNHPMMGGPAMGGPAMGGPAMGGPAMGYPPMAPSAGAPGMAFSPTGGPPAMSSPMAGGPAIGFLPTPVAPARFSPIMGPPAMAPGFAPGGGPPAAVAAAMGFPPIGGAPAMAAPAGRAFLGPSGSAPRPLGPAAPVRPSPFPPPSYDMTAATNYDQMVRRIIWIAFAVVALILIVVITR